MHQTSFIFMENASKDRSLWCRDERTRTRISRKYRTRTNTNMSFSRKYRTRTNTNMIFFEIVEHERTRTLVYFHPCFDANDPSVQLKTVYFSTDRTNFRNLSIWAPSTHFFFMKTMHLYLTNRDFRSEAFLAQLVSASVS